MKLDSRNFIQNEQAQSDVKKACPEWFYGLSPSTEKTIFRGDNMYFLNKINDYEYTEYIQPFEDFDFGKPAVGSFSHCGVCGVLYWTSHKNERRDACGRCSDLSYLYIFVCENRTMKIGVSSNPLLRIEQVKRDWRKDMKIFAFAPYRKNEIFSAEKDIHQAFDFFAMGREWFSCPAPSTLVSAAFALSRYSFRVTVSNSFFYF